MQTPSPTPSRRALLALAGALPVAAVPIVAIAAPAADDDAELIRLCRRLNAMNDELDAHDRGERGSADIPGELIDDHHDAVLVLADTAATTLTGLFAKASVAVREMEHHVNEFGSAELAGLSALDDVVALLGGRAAA